MSVPALVDKLKDTIQDCNINFLLGSGLSSPYLTVLGNVEKLLTELDSAELEPTPKKVIRASIYKRYFDSVISKNLQILNGDEAAAAVLREYKNLLHCLNAILLKRKVTILSKEINLFTTNIDIFLDKALEQLNLQYNDGFNGRFKPTFSLSNFKISRFKKSLHYDKVAELPVFNLLKLHGSLSWETEANDSLIFSPDLHHVKEVGEARLTNDHLVDIAADADIGKLAQLTAGKKADESTDAFLEAYDKLLIIVNPTKEKFRYTLMNQTYYELLRLYSNELEKENTVLFVMGFSFADEHIREITVRAANSNPTLMIYVIAHTSKSKAQIDAALGPTSIRNNNVQIIAPVQQDHADGQSRDSFEYDLSTINKKLFAAVLSRIESPEPRANE